MPRHNTAGLRVSTKSVERQAEQIGAEIMRLEQAEIQRSVQLELPIPVGPPIPILYVEIDGTGIRGSRLNRASAVASFDVSF